MLLCLLLLCSGVCLDAQLWSELDDVGNESEAEGEDEDEDGSDGLAAFMKAFMVSAAAQLWTCGCVCVRACACVWLCMHCHLSRPGLATWHDLA